MLTGGNSLWTSLCNSEGLQLYLPSGRMMCTLKSLDMNHTKAAIYEFSLFISLIYHKRVLLFILQQYWTYSYFNKIKNLISFEKKII